MRVRLPLLMGLLISTSTTIAYAQGLPHKICTIADFEKFVSQYMNLTEEQQYTCVSYPVKVFPDSAKLLKTKKQLKTFLGEGKLVLSPNDIKSPSVSRPFVSSAKNNKIQPNRIGYVYMAQPEGMGLSLAEGGTSVFGEIRFARKDDYWMLVAASGWIDD